MCCSSVVPKHPLRALSEATQTIPIVVCAVDFDPEAGGFVKSLAHPGGNVTGVYGSTNRGDRQAR